MNRLFLVRHGPTHMRAMVGWADLPADLGDQTALARLDAWLPGEGLVVSSDLHRARATADAIAGNRQRLPHRRSLREINFGAWELKSYDEIDATAPDLIRAFWERPGDSAPPGGESWNQVRRRVDRTIDALIRAHPGRDLIVVAHFGVILTQIQRSLSVPAVAAFAHEIDNLSVTSIVLGADGWRAEAINHLP
ncbi:histidine phosphatase family protein [Pontibaca methylaminivorans]|uniref:histidine phosphatase family protein n=1 Tax=Pontibaca methylaminivorans TaxID=515897 RepID=UPI002FD8ABDD